jgi:hypothetical protein
LNSIAHRPSAVPAVDWRTNGHGAFAVQAAEQTRQRADQLAAVAAREHREPAAAPDRLRLEQLGAETAEVTEHAIQLKMERRRIADRLNPTKDGVPLDAVESPRKQYSAGAFDLALDALDAALEYSEDQALTIRVIRGWLRLAEDEIREEPGA